MKEAVDLLNDFGLDKETTVQKMFNSSTTHLIVDFESTFDNGDIDLRSKLIILLSALKKCKIIRHEWLIHSKTKQVWLDEEKYLLQNYLGPDLSEYSEFDFDVKVVKLIRKLEKDRLTCFSRYKNIFIIKERLDNKSSPVFDDVALFTSKSALQTILSQIITLCGGSVTNEIAKGKFMIAMDKTNDYEEENKSHQEKVKLDQRYFLTCVNKLKSLIERPNVDVISSEWVIGNLISIAWYNIKQTHHFFVFRFNPREFIC